MSNNSLLSGTSWAISAHAVRVLLSLILVPVLVTNLGIEGYGYFVALTIISTYQGLANVVELGYTTFISSLLLNDHKYNENIEKRLNGFIFIIFIFNIFGIILFYLLKDYYRNPDFLYSGIIILISNFFSIYFIACSSVFLGYNNFKEIKKSETYSYIIYALLVIVIIPLSKNLITLSILFLLFQLISSVIIGIKFNKFYGKLIFPKYIKISTIISDWNKVKPFFWIKLSGTVVRSTDNVFILSILGPYELGIYDLILKIPHAIKGIFGKVSEALGPYLFRTFKYNTKHLHEIIINNLLVIQITFGLQTFILIYFNGQTIINYLFGIDLSYFNLFLIALLINIFNPISSVCSQAILYDDNNKKLSKFGIYNSLLNLALMWPVTYIFGISGSLYLTLIQYLFLSIIVLLIYRENFYIDIYKIFLTCALFASVSFIFQYFVNYLSYNIYINIILCYVFYLLVIYRRLATLIKYSKIKYYE